MERWTVMAIRSSPAAQLLDIDSTDCRNVLVNRDELVKSVKTVDTCCGATVKLTGICAHVFAYTRVRVVSSHLAP